MLLERLPIHIGNLRALPARLEPKDREQCAHSGTLTCEMMREYTVTVDEIHALGMNLQQAISHARTGAGGAPTQARACACTKPSTHA